MAYQSKHTGSAIDGAIDVVIQKNAAWDNKQDKLTGAAGQLVIFDENGDPIAQDMPDIDIDTDNLVTLEGGGEIDMAEAFGEGPYVISFTPDEEIAPSDSGIAIGPDEPTDTDVWIDTDDDEDDGTDYVVSFNGREGAVMPQTGDYTPDMIGAAPDVHTHKDALTFTASTISTGDGTDVTEDIARAITPHIDALPNITASDNGKFLRVVNGAWSVATVRNAEEVSF